MRVGQMFCFWGVGKARTSVTGELESESGHISESGTQPKRVREREEQDAKKVLGRCSVRWNLWPLPPRLVS